jgi:hypothetical protein
MMEHIRIAIEAMQTMQTAWVRSGRGECESDRWWASEVGLVCVRAYDMPKGFEPYADFNILAYQVDYVRDEPDACRRVTYSEAPEVLNDMADCAWSEHNEDHEATAAALGLPFWSAAWESEKVWEHIDCGNGSCCDDECEP